MQVPLVDLKAQYEASTIYPEPTEETVRYVCAAIRRFR